MQNVTTLQTLTCQGQDIMLLVDYVSDIQVRLKNPSGNFLLVDTLTETGAVRYPGYAGAVYQVIFSAGSVAVLGACRVGD